MQVGLCRRIPRRGGGFGGAVQLPKKILLRSYQVFLVLGCSFVNIATVGSRILLALIRWTDIERCHLSSRFCEQTQIRHVTTDRCSDSCSAHTRTYAYLQTSCKEKDSLGVIEFVLLPSGTAGTGKSASSEPSCSCSHSLRAVGILQRR